ncbi:MAG: hypothetical protein NT122_02865 [Solirubrobacterales bacterium]|nr:hypothetical protein [Solirubrobacterales bacterium]
MGEPENPLTVPDALPEGFSSTDKVPDKEVEGVDLAIKPDASNEQSANEVEAVESTEVASVPSIPFGAIFRSVVAVLVVVMLFVIAGNVKLEACVAKAQATYGPVLPGKANNLTNLARRNAINRCSASPF